MKITITDLEPREIIKDMECLLKRGRFSDDIITNTLEKKALECMIQEYKENINFEKSISYLEKYLDNLELEQYLDDLEYRRSKLDKGGD